MSTSTDGILFWGIAYDDNEQDDEDDEESGIRSFGELYEIIDEALTEDRDAVNPEPAVAGYQGPEWDAWRERNIALQAEQCVFGWHCSAEYPMYYVAVKSVTASRGYPQEIKPEDLVVGADWPDRLKEFCVRFGLPWKEPKWWLCSYWG